MLKVLTIIHEILWSPSLGIFPPRFVGIRLVRVESPRTRLVVSLLLHSEVWYLNILQTPLWSFLFHSHRGFHQSLVWRLTESLNQSNRRMVHYNVNPSELAIFSSTEAIIFFRRALNCDQASCSIARHASSKNVSQYSKGSAKVFNA